MKWLLFAMCSVLLWSGGHTSRDNTGTEFIVGFMWNTIVTQVGLEIFVTTMSNTPADVTVTAPLYDSSLIVTATVARQQVELMVLPYHTRVEDTGLSNKGVRIVSTQPITVYCVNKEQYTTDAYMALPVHVVGQEYYSVHYIRSPQILVVGITDGTSVSVRMSDNSRSGSLTYVNNVNVNWNGNNYGNGETMSFTVNRYQTFFITQYDDYDADFTGSYITSNKPISAISGNYRCHVVSTPPDGSRRSSDHLTEMLPPVDSWGKTFVSTSTPDREIGDMYRIVASEANTYVNMGNGRTTFTLARAGDFKEVDIRTDQHVTINADKPIMVAMIAKTWQNDGLHYGDPAMSLISPTNQYASEYTWSTTNLPSGDPFNNKVAVIIDKSKRGDLLLDGSAMSTSGWQSVTGSNDMVQKWVFVNPGSHNIYHRDPSATFFAVASGTEQWNSYAFAAGTRMAQINAPCSPTTPVAGDTVDNDCDSLVDEEALDNIDNDGDGRVDEDLALPPRVDGSWGSWNGWTCSVTCGAMGTNTRTRACDDPAPQNNGEDCPGSDTQTKNCDMRGSPCPVDGGLTNWSGWGSCSVTCDSGTQTSTRSCTAPSPQHGGAQCVGALSRSQACSTGVSCDVDGGWGTWAAWSSCSVTCATGTQIRNRNCDRPARVGNGADCPGSNSDSKACVLPPCPIDGGWGTWTPWGTCSVTCEVGTHTRSRVCDRPAPLHNGADCPGSDVASQTCTMVPCPIDGEWGTWGAWGDCSLSCGGVGALERNRSCDRPQPQYGGANCTGGHLDYTPCDVSHLRCPSGNVWEILTYTTAAPSPVDGGFGPWSNWTECSVVCGGGVRFKQRFCNSPKPQGSGQPCQGSYVEEEMCNTAACVANGYAHGVAHGGVCNGRRGLFDCQNGIQCIDILKKCDCIPNCADGSDETISYAGCIIDLDQCTNTAETKVSKSHFLMFWALLAGLLLQLLL